MSTLSDSDAEDAAAFELDELDLGDEEGHGGGRAAGGIEAAGRANVDLRMERLPPGQTCQPLSRTNHRTNDRQHNNTDTIAPAQIAA